MSQILETNHAERFASDWLGAWNSHDLDRILGHYTDDVEYHSPFVSKLTGDPRGRLRGKHAVRGYVAQALAKYPDLRFEMRNLLLGADSVTIEYQGVDHLVAAEVFVLDDLGRAREVRCHYHHASGER